MTLESQRRHAQGAAAEQLAARYLEARGIVVLARNLRCKAGEIDLVCRDGDILAIVEVRQRKTAGYGGALASVTWRKQRKIMRAAGFFLQRRADWRACTLRFDVVAVAGMPDRGPEILLLKDAFRPAI
jgi:putative endonuclease